MTQQQDMYDRAGLAETLVGRLEDAARGLGRKADGIVRRQARGYWTRLKRSERKASKALVSGEERRERRRLEAEDQARRRGEGEAAREAQRARKRSIAEIDGTQHGVPLGLAPRERPAWVMGGDELVVVGENEYVQAEQACAPTTTPRGSPARVVGQVRMASKRKRIEHVATQAGMEVEYDALQSFTVAARRVGSRGGGAATGGRGRGRGGPGASKRAAGMLAAADGSTLPDGGGKKTRILRGPEGSG